MATKTIVVMQPYLRGPKNKLTKGAPRAAKDVDEAKRWAERAIQTVAGAVVFSIEYDEKTDFADEPVFIASYGEVPEMASA